MLLEIYSSYKNAHGASLCIPRELIKPLSDEGLFWHCATSIGGEDLDYSDWYFIEELLIAHGVTKFSYIDNREKE